MNADQLLSIARECRAAAEAMTGGELDDWYEEHVGYRPTEDDQTMAPQELTSTIASAMFYHRMPEGLDTPGAETMGDLLANAIETGSEL